MALLDGPVRSEGRRRGAREVSDDVLGAFNFLLEIEGFGHGERQIVAGFTSIEGGGVRIQRRDVTDGTCSGRRFAPGAVEFEPITLCRGLTRNRDLLEWFDRVVGGEADLRSGSVLIIEPDGSEVRRFDFIDAWPQSWSGLHLDAGSSSLLVERFEIAVGSARWH